LYPIVPHLQVSRTKLLSAAEVIAHVAIIEETAIFGMKRLLRAEPKLVPLGKRFHLPLAMAAWGARKVGTPIPLDEKRIRDKQESPSGLFATRQATLESIESTRGTDVSAYRYDHPFLGSLNMYEWFRAIGSTKYATRNNSVNL
jgi:hypothetical protein